MGELVAFFAGARAGLERALNDLEEPSNGFEGSSDELEKPVNGFESSSNRFESFSNRMKTLPTSWEALPMTWKTLQIGFKTLSTTWKKVFCWIGKVDRELLLLIVHEQRPEFQLLLLRRARHGIDESFHQSQGSGVFLLRLENLRFHARCLVGGGVDLVVLRVCADNADEE